MTKRHVPLERYTEKARRVVFFARYEAAQMGDAMIESEHLLLGLMRDEKGLVIKLLGVSGHNLTLKELRELITKRTIPRRPSPPPSMSVELPYGNSCYVALEYATEEADKLTSRAIMPEHVTLGILRDEGSLATAILKECGVDYAKALEIISPQSARILKEISSNRPRPLNEAKLILVGRGAVGKTSLVNRLVNDLFRDETKTQGIRITKWNLTVGDEEVLLNVWDFGGQEIMHATHQFFLTQRSLYLLVLNGREGGEDADADYWLKLIESFGGESPVVVVMNKIKEHPFDVNRRALRQKYPAVRDFVKTDCADGTGIKQLRKTIERETDRLEGLRDEFPASWFAIKDKLALMRNNYLSYDQYREVCAGLGEDDPDAQEALAFYLHNLGIALNFKDDPRLNDTHVLNPHWVTDGVYKILNSELLEAHKGEIRLGDLHDILDRTQYPSNMHRFLFDLMKKFELCFSFPDDDCHYLVPELLDKQEPAQIERFKPEACLNFQYHYSVLPEGLLPRFIVRTHALSEGLPRWRSGVCLKFEANEALVKADIQERKVFVSVAGPHSGRRRLLAIIRSDLDRIHRDIRKLQPSEMVPLPGYPEVVTPYEELLVMERHNIKQLTKVVGDRIIAPHVSELLNGVDLEGVRRTASSINTTVTPLRLFISYSHKDEGLRNEMEAHIKLLQRQGLIESWHDRKIVAGEEWGERISENLERADVILLLVSADFLNSDYCYDVEMQCALEKHEKKEARVIPVIVRDVSWSHAPFAKLQALPKDGLPVTKWADRDSAWRSVAEGVGKLAEEMRE